MNVLVIWSSPNEQGLTASAKDSVVAGLEEYMADVRTVPLNRLKIRNCLTCGDGWGKCREQGVCIIQDDFLQLYEDMAEADGCILITPVYWHDMSENLKCFLDRLRRCETAHNHWLAGKSCMLVACAGGTGLGVIQCLMHMEEVMSHMKIQTVDRLPVIRFNKDYVIPALHGAGEAFAEYLEKTGGHYES